MKIAYCIPSCHKSGGMERVLSIKANYLADVLGWDVTIITTEVSDEERHFTLSERVRVHCLDVNYGDNRNFASLLIHRFACKRKHRQRLARFLLAEHFDVCVSMFCHEMSFLTSIRDGSKKVLELHFCKSFRYLDQLYNGRSLLVRGLGYVQTFYEQSKIKHYDAFVVLSKEDALKWERVCRCKVISNPAITPEVTYPDYAAKRAVAVGRICPQKGFDMLLRIWNMLPTALKDEWKLDIYGGGNQRELLAQIQEMGLQKTVQLCGVSKDIIRELQRASVFCFPSRYEGFGMALAEAMLTGLPPVSFSCPSGPSDIITHGKTGYLVPVGDLQEFCTLLQDLMQDQKRREEMGRAARAFVSSTYSLEIIMKKWETLFRELISVER